MKYKGCELLKAIVNGEIKEGSLILFDSIIWIVDEYSDIVKYQEEHITLFNTYKAKEIATGEFELVEDEIDIEKMKYSTNQNEGTIIKSSSDNEKEKELRNYIVNNMKDIDKMSADEMFKELGYVKNVDTPTNFIYQNERNNKEIRFYKIDKCVEVSLIEFEEFEGNSIFFTMQELQAINKEVDELGWMD